LPAYYNALDQQQLPLAKGLVMTRDDELRRAAIHDLLCQSTLDIPSFEQAWGIEFANYFSLELAQMQPLERDGLVEITDDSIDITPRGRFLARVVAMGFDRHLREATSSAKFSRVI
jgi:oxygen-independent coproporphyrinogen-3 oxidase